MAKIQRTKNAYRNVLFGTIFKIYTLLMPFLMRTLLIYNLGIKYAGLSSLFTSILQVLNLTELGVGSVMVFNMYKPIAEDDTVKICALMKLYKLYYRIIGAMVAVFGIAVTPFLPKLIAETVPEGISLYILYFLELGTTVLSYWLFAYKAALLSAHQRIDISSKVSITTKTLQYFLQIIVLVCFKNYYLYLVIALFDAILTNIITAIIADKMYPSYKPEGELEKSEIKSINRRIRDLFTAKLATVLGRSVDSIVISSFIGLTALAIYQNYYFIINSIAGFAMLFFNAVRAGIGNSLVIESEEKNYRDFKKLSFVIMWFTNVCIACFITLYQPFMKMWVGQQYLLPYYMVVLYCVYFFLIVSQDLSCAYKDASGIWHEDRLRPLIAGVLNLVLNLMMVKRWGLPGILLSTIVSYVVVAMPWLIANLFRLVFKRSPKEYVFQLSLSFLLSALIGALCYVLDSFIRIEGIFGLVIRLLLSLMVSNLLLLLIYRKNSMFKELLNLVKNLLLSKGRNTTAR